MKITLEDMAKTVGMFPALPRGYRCNSRTYEELKRQCGEIRAAGERPPRFTGTSVEIDDRLKDGIFRPIP